MSELRKIPNVGETTEQDLIAMGYTTIESLKGKSADNCMPKNAPCADAPSTVVSFTCIVPLNIL